MANYFYLTLTFCSFTIIIIAKTSKLITKVFLTLTLQESEAPPPAAPHASITEDKSKPDPEPPPSTPQRNKLTSDPQDKTRLGV